MKIRVEIEKNIPLSKIFRAGVLRKTAYTIIMVVFLVGFYGCKTPGRQQSHDPFMPNVGQVAIPEIETGKAVPNADNQYSPPGTNGPYSSGGASAPSIIVPDITEEGGVILKPGANYGDDSSSSSAVPYNQGWTTLGESSGNDISVTVPITASETTAVQSPDMENFAASSFGTAPYGGSAQVRTSIDGAKDTPGEMYTKPYAE